MPASEANTEHAARLAEAVREAGALALSMFRKPIGQWTKGGSSPVCEADIAVDRLLHERLADADAGFAWLSEESADDPARLDARHVWIVDPIDGTRAYLAGLPDWTISAALVADGRPVAACLFAPAIEEFFMATAGKGATRNGIAIAASPGDAVEHARIAGPRSFVERLAQVAPPFKVMPRGGSLALRLARVADGTFDAAFAGGNSHDWDLAAADLLVHEAGGTITQFGGRPVIYNRAAPRHGALVAAGRARHAALIALITERRIAL